MQIIGMSLVKNEEDIIENFIRHNLQFLDGIFIFDNCSTDATRSILKALMQEGLPICLSDDHEYSYSQSQKTTNLLRRIVSCIPVNYIMPLDADEFIECESHEDFLSSIEKINSPGIGYIRWKTYLFSPEMINNEQKIVDPNQFKYCRKEERPQYYKIILRNPADNLSSLALTPGNHSIICESNLQAVNIDGISLAHFPVRSSSQITKKSIFGTLACKMTETRIKKKLPQVCYQWRQLYGKILDGYQLQTSDLVELSLNYAQLPGGLSWPENICEGQLQSREIKNNYTQLINDDLLIQTIKGFQKYVEGENCLFNPDNFFDLNDIKTEKKLDFQPESKNALDEVNDIYLDIPPHKYMSERFSPESILEIGCGLGQNLRLYNNLGSKNTVGVDDIEPRIFYISPRNYIKQDVNQSFLLEQKFDLVLCLGASQKLSIGNEDAFISDITAHAKNLILFSTANHDSIEAVGKPDQKKNLEFWAEKWFEKGWVPLLFETLGFRSLSTFSWLRQNSVVLKHDVNDPDAYEKWLLLTLLDDGEYQHAHYRHRLITEPLKHWI